MTVHRLAALCAIAVAGCAAQDLISVVESDWNVSESGTFIVYLGPGRVASITDVVSTVENCDGTTTEVTARVMYAPQGSGICIPVTRSSESCVWISNSTDADGDFTRGDDLVTGAEEALYAAGPDVVEYFGEYTVTIVTCTPEQDAVVNVNWTSSVTNPSDGFCVMPQDSEVISGDDAPAIDYFATEAELPRHSSRLFVAETQYVPGLNTISVSPTFCYERATCTTTDDCDADEVCLNSCCKPGSQLVYDLGLGPQMDLSCVNVFTSPSVASPPTGCTSGTDEYTLTLVDVINCNEFADRLTSPYDGCCSITSEEECSFYEASSSSDRVCMWAAGRCYPTIGMNEVDLKSSSVLDDKQSVFSFSASAVNGPTTDYIRLDNGVFDPTDNNVGNRRWFLKYTLLDVADDPTTGACNSFVTLSFKSTTTGGLCEPSSRIFCDSQSATCMRTDPMDYPRYWRWNEDASEVVSDYYDDEYKTCNCLKQKEVCYRKNGCVSTKRYQLILMNCLDQGCGNWCSP